ncbi:major facilitator superfamily domain-containing protein [Echria macrotheca]|uniref:Major facilitator superfamily domain-containing protein n=1 Tax=Echria macrotheca TaxID=438768 RepID=A0AAJ0BNK1_9PEZI|nr:major facilitator superfamily domain-containing protein [Echria macrotheca]
MPDSKERSQSSSSGLSSSGRFPFISPIPEDVPEEEEQQHFDDSSQGHRRQPITTDGMLPDHLRLQYEAYQQQQQQQEESYSSNGVQADDFGQPRESVQARESVQSHQGRCARCHKEYIVELVDEKDVTEYHHSQAAAAPGVSTFRAAAATAARYSSSDEEKEEEEEMIVAWDEGDRGNPYNWSGWKKRGVLLITMMLIINSTMGSALPSNALPFIAAEWDITSQQQKVLPISVYLIGYILGPIFWAPMSEQFGRRLPTLSSFFLFTLFTMACALSPNWPAFLVFRLLTGVFASAPIAIVPGIIADTHGDPRTRGRSMGIFFATTLMGPLLAPIVSGYTAPAIGWRWVFWIGLIYAAATLLVLLCLPETSGAILLVRRAKAIRKRNPSARIIAPHEMDKKTPTELATVVLTRPLRMILFEPIVNTSCAYLALVYAVFYMSFEAYPIIFMGLYGLSPGECGLTYLAIGVGCLLALPVFFVWDNILRRAQARNAHWTRREESRRLPLACIGGPLFVVSLFWLGWASSPQVHFMVPMLAGIPFGFGFMCIFQALLNYLTDAYEIFAASANAAASCSRSLLATVLPLATAPMFARLGIAGACSLLGGLATLMCVIPFLFLWQGPRIRASSKFCIALKKRKEEMAAKIEAQRKRRSSPPPNPPVLGPPGQPGMVGMAGMEMEMEMGNRAESGIGLSELSGSSISASAPATAPATGFASPRYSTPAAPAPALVVNGNGYENGNEMVPYGYPSYPSAAVVPPVGRTWSGTTTPFMVPMMYQQQGYPEQQVQVLVPAMVMLVSHERQFVSPREDV